MRVSAKPIGRYPFYLRPFFWNQRRKYGQVLQAALLWARSPKLFIGVAVLYGMIDRRSSPIDPALRSLVTVRVSQINDCPFCVDINSATLLKRGVSAEKVEALHVWRESLLFDRVYRDDDEIGPEGRGCHCGSTPSPLRRGWNYRVDGPDRLPKHVQQVQQCTRRTVPGILQAARQR